MRLFVFAASPLLAQISPAGPEFKPPSAFLHHVQGEVSINGAAVDEVRFGMKVGKFPELKQGDTVRTGLGLAEMLLSPGMTVRVGENGEVRVSNPAGPAVEVELVAGAVAVEAIDVKAKGLTIRLRDFAVTMKKPGALRMGVDPAEVRVYDGLAEVVSGGRKREVKKGYAAGLDAMVAVAKFDMNRNDALVRWSLRRAQAVNLANIGAARYLFNANAPWGGAGWYFNPFFGMWTYMPGSGDYYCSGWYGCYYAPDRVEAWYRRQSQPSASVAAAASGPTWNAATANQTVSQRSYESAPVSETVSSPPASVDTSSRGGESAAGRGGEGGGRSQ